ncbi:hypothetical protein C8P68_10231 [Mucilaginibacter yixingensis]|uniref:Uncharacterized protein n=1 Tax=Mucilaginibacter yixingensis TaxID=1295612 RepID=A0A2T5JC23_9SPHI|nr:hypothetical protein [Mucilaginibacter yixingensis]PTQ99215.1 hypothetical protein C8P68_10231 [Mucilaginibacter yixingensis]
MIILKLFTFNTVSELVCFIVTLFCLTKDKNVAWRSMVFFMLLTCVVEFTGAYLKALYRISPSMAHSNVWLYNIFGIVEASFISLMFNNLFKMYFNSRPVIIGGLVLIVASFGYELATRGIMLGFHITATIAAIIFILYGLVYFYHLLKADAFYDLKVYPPFWWVAGVLFFYFGSTVISIFFDQITERLSLLIVAPRRYITGYIYAVLNLLLYGCWSYAFVCKKWLIKTSPDYSS